MTAQASAKRDRRGDGRCSGTAGATGPASRMERAVGSIPQHKGSRDGGATVTPPAPPPKWPPDRHPTREWRVLIIEDQRWLAVELVYLGGQIRARAAARAGPGRAGAGGGAGSDRWKAQAISLMTEGDAPRSILWRLRWHTSMDFSCPSPRKTAGLPPHRAEGGQGLAGARRARVPGVRRRRPQCEGMGTRSRAGSRSSPARRWSSRGSSTSRARIAIGSTPR